MQDRCLLYFNKVLYSFRKIQVRKKLFLWTIPEYLGGRMGVCEISVFFLFFFKFFKSISILFSLSVSNFSFNEAVN